MNVFCNCISVKGKRKTIEDEDQEDDDVDKVSNDEPFMCDFDIMMQRKREENRSLHNKRRRGTKDIEMINDNDDAIAKLMADMRMAAHEDRELNQKGPFQHKMTQRWAIFIQFILFRRACHQEVGHVASREKVPG